MKTPMRLRPAPITAPLIHNLIPTMKPSCTIILLALALGSTLPTGAYAFSGGVDNLFTTIPDNDPNGIQSSQTLTGIPGVVGHVTVTLNITGGFNGDYYADRKSTRLNSSHL